MSIQPLPSSGSLLLCAAASLPRGLARRSLETTLQGRYAAPALDAAAVAAYGAYFGGFASDLPLTLLYPLAQRAQLARLVAPDCPYALPGLIHVSNAQARLGPLALDQPWVLDVRIARAEETGAGERLALEVLFEQGGEVRASCHSTYLARKAPRRAGGPTSVAEAPPGDFSEDWVLGAAEGRRYAALSGDYNPVHLHPLLSRLFGYPRPIWHGMAAVGRAVAAMERAGGREVTAVDVKFKRPISLPARPTLAWGGGQFRLLSGDGAVVHLEGTVVPASRDASPV